MQVMVFSWIAQALSSPLFGKLLTMFAPIRRADGDERARHCRPGWERCWQGTRSYPCGSRLDWMGTASQLRSVSITGHVGSEPNQELASSSDIEGAWHKHRCQLAVWNCRAEGNGPYRRKSSARCFQEGHGGAPFFGCVREVGPGNPLSEQCGLPCLCNEADCRREAGSRGIGAEGGVTFTCH